MLARAFRLFWCFQNRRSRRVSSKPVFKRLDILRLKKGSGSKLYSEWTCCGNKSGRWHLVLNKERAKDRSNFLSIWRTRNVFSQAFKEYLFSHFSSLLDLCEILYLGQICVTNMEFTSQAQRNTPLGAGQISITWLLIQKSHVHYLNCHSVMNFHNNKMRQNRDHFTFWHPPKNVKSLIFIVKYVMPHTLHGIMKNRRSLLTFIQNG